MATYITMTPGGMFGSKFQAADDDAAMAEARRQGYRPAEVIEHGDDLVVVVED